MPIKAPSPVWPLGVLICAGPNQGRGSNLFLSWSQHFLYLMLDIIGSFFGSFTPRLAANGVQFWQIA